VYSLYALPRLLYVLPRKQRRLLPLSELPLGGIALLASRAALGFCLLAANIALAIRWEGSPDLRDTYSGQMAWALEIVAAVSDAIQLMFTETDEIGDYPRLGLA
jgi:hypothetical protein